jgi:hypothetical protein
MLLCMHICYFVNEKHGMCSMPWEDETCLISHLIRSIFVPEERTLKSSYVQTQSGCSKSANIP